MGKISPALFKLAYALGRRVYAGNLPQKDAEAQLEQAGMNKTSASFSIGNLRQMINGAAYHRAMSLAQTRYFLTAIYTNDGLPGLKNAVRAFGAHLPYLRISNRNTMPGLTALLNEFQQLANLPPSAEDALNDLLEKPEGVQAPARTERKSSGYQRNPVVRAYVINRARGRCEFCGELGFALTKGKRYVETHHIIALAKQGPDTPENVIALCANHHREAHFGTTAQALEEKFLSILRSIEESGD